MDNSIKYVNIEDLIPGEFQAHFENIGDNIDNLANSIRKHGIIVPLIVREKGINQYEIILGNRRYSAARAIGLNQIPVIVLNVDDEKALDIVISDNIQRRELTAREEAYLYDKDLEYTNNNEENLSNKLGIPLDRILSKLSFIRKDNQPEPNQNFTSNLSEPLNNISTNSSINKDIINISELNKEEREDFNMNNDIINNQNLNTDPSKVPTTQQAVEPTFGGRFFPSLEDTPTNMDMNQNNSNFGTTQPLIDLTETATNNSNQQAPEQIPNLNNNQINSVQNTSNNINTNTLPNETTNNNINNSLDIQQEQPNVPNLDALSTNIVDNNLETAPNEPVIPNINESSINVQPLPNISNDNTNQEFEVNNQQQLPNNNILNEQPISENIQTNSAIGNSLNQEVPQSEQISVTNNDYNINPMPNLEDISNNNQTPISNSTEIDNLINNNIPSNPEIGMNVNNPAITKNIIPVVNMIKSLAVNIENLGYNLNITENENEGSYSIKIEVEK